MAGLDRAAGRERISPQDWQKLVEAGIVDRVEMIEGRALMGRYPVVFSPAQTAAARELGVEVPSAVDAVLGDPDARAEVAKRLKQGD